MAPRIYTKTGDRGETGLYGGARVPKDHVRVEAYGCVDELNALLGQVLAFQPAERLGSAIAQVQPLLLELGAELATPAGKKATAGGIRLADIVELERQIDSLEADLLPLKTFIVPAGPLVCATLHVARTVCRRAERRLVTLLRAEPETSPTTLLFLNRLSDLLFVMARWASAKAGARETPWKRR